jgi:hypothetical protein
MVGEIVAEKRAVWRPAGVAERIVSRSSAKPMSSISSASSRTTASTASSRRLPRVGVARRADTTSAALSPRALPMGCPRPEDAGTQRLPV